MFRYRHLILAVVVCFSLAGCGPKTNYKYRIAVIPKGETHEFWQSIRRGAERAAADLGAKGIPTEIVWQATATEGDATEQIQLIGRMSGMGIHGMVLAPQHSKQMIAPVEEVVRQNIPVVIIDSDLDNSDLYVKYVATNNYNGGRLAAEHLLKVLKEEGNAAPNLILLRYDIGSESTEQREQGFLDYVNERIAEQKQAGQPTITLLSTNQHAGDTAEKARRVAGPLLTSLEDKRIDGIFAVNESATDGLLQALRSQGKAGKIKVMGFDSSKPLLQALRDDELVGLVIQDPYRMGYLGVWHAVMHLEGYDVSAGGKSLSTGEYVVTKDNLDDEEVRNKFEPDLQAKRTIKTPEYKKR